MQTDKNFKFKKEHKVMLSFVDDKNEKDRLKKILINAQNSFEVNRRKKIKTPNSNDNEE